MPPKYMITDTRALWSRKTRQKRYDANNRPRNFESRWFSPCNNEPYVKNTHARHKGSCKNHHTRLYATRKKEEENGKEGTHDDNEIQGKKPRSSYKKQLIGNKETGRHEKKEGRTAPSHQPGANRIDEAIQPTSYCDCGWVKSTHHVACVLK